MSRLHLALLFLLGAALSPGATPAPDNRFSQIPDDYKHPLTVPSNFFNPFKIDAAGDDLGHRDFATVKDDAVVAALAHRGLSGIVFDASPAQSRVIIGDEVFAVGEEVQFADDSGTAPLVANATVVLKAVDPDKLVFAVTPVNEPTRRLSYPLRSFLGP